MASQDAKEESDAEDEMIERVLNEAVVEAMMEAIEMGEHADDAQESQEDDVVKECPLCHSPCRYFSVNLRDRLLSCENMDCDFPYGYGEIQVVCDPRWRRGDEVDLARILPELLIDEVELRFTPLEGVGGPVGGME